MAARRKFVYISALLKALSQGKYPAQIAKELGVTPQSLNRHLRKLEKSNRIVRTSLYPALYKVVVGGGDVNQSKRGVVDFEGSVDSPDRTLEPHYFGERYRVVSGQVSGGIKWFLKSGVACQRFKEPSFTIMVTPRSVTFWLKRFKGGHPQELIVKGREMLRVRIAAFAVEHGLQLEFAGYAGERHWTTTLPGQGLSKEMIVGLDLQKAARRVGDALLLTDKSHLGRAEAVSVEKGGSDAFAVSFHKLIVNQPELFKFVEQQVLINQQFYEILGFVKSNKGLIGRDELGRRDYG